MTDHIRCALAWLRALFVARVHEPRAEAFSARPAASAPAPAHHRLPRHSTPHSTPYVDGSASPLVRPYLTAHEQQDRRTALALALDGIDVGPWIIYGVSVPVGAAV